MQPTHAATVSTVGDFITALVAALGTGPVTIEHVVLDDLACTYDASHPTRGMVVQLAYDLPAAEQESVLARGLLAAHDALRAGERFGGLRPSAGSTAA